MKKLLLIGILSIVSLSSFAMDLDQFANTCTKQMKQIGSIAQRAEDHYSNGPASELKFAEGRVILASLRGFIIDAKECSDVDVHIPEILAVMKKLKIN